MRRQFSGSRASAPLASGHMMACRLYCCLGIGSPMPIYALWGHFPGASLIGSARSAPQMELLTRDAPVERCDSRGLSPTACPRRTHDTPTCIYAGAPPNKLRLRAGGLLADEHFNEVAHLTSSFKDFFSIDAETDLYGIGGFISQNNKIRAYACLTSWRVC